MKSKQMWKRISAVVLSAILAATPTGVYAKNVQSQEQVERAADVQQENVTGKESGATSGECGKNVKWKYDEATKTLTISGSGAMQEDMDSFEHPWNDLDIKTVQIGQGVTTIANCAFYDCENLQTVEIPEGVTKIGYNAFYDCGKLKTVTIPDSVTEIGEEAFSCCDSLKTVTIPGSVTEIGERAFCACANLKLVKILEGVSKIGEKAFSGCKNLKKIEIPASVTEIGYDAFDGCEDLTIVGVLGSKAASLYGANITFQPISTTSGMCGEKAKWSYDESTKTLEISGTGEMGSSPYWKDFEIEKVEIKEGITSIKEGTFWECSSLKDLKIPSSVTQIIGNPFQNLNEGCEQLSNVSVDVNNQNYDFKDGNLYGIKEHTLVFSSGKGNVEIPNGVTNILDFAFRNNTEVTSITIPDSVTSIGAGAFEGCSNLVNVNIPQGIKEIGYRAFYGCKNLSSVKLPDSVTSIGGYAFFGCENLKNINLPNGLQEFGGGTFYGCKSLKKIYIPASVTVIYDDFSSTFGSCIDLEDIEVAEDNSKYCSKEGSLCSKDGKTLLRAAAKSNFEFPEGIKLVEAFAFEGCSNLESVDIPEGVTTIGYEAFRGCDHLKKVKIPSSLINEDAFAHCGNIEEFIVDENNKICCSIDGSLYTKDGTVLVYAAAKSNFVVPEGVEVSESAFTSHTTLESVTIPNSVTTLSFEGCSNLKNIQIPRGMDTIRSRAFAECTSLESIEIPSTVNKIEYMAFLDCTNLKQILIPKQVSVADGAFSGCENLTIYGEKDSDAERIAKENKIPFKPISEFGNPSNEPSGSEEPTTPEQPSTPEEISTPSIPKDSQTAGDELDINLDYTNKEKEIKMTQEDADAIKEAFGYTAFGDNLIPVLQENSAAVINWKDSILNFEDVYATEIFCPVLRRDENDKLVIEKDANGNVKKTFSAIAYWNGNQKDAQSIPEGSYFDLRDAQYQTDHCINQKMGLTTFTQLGKQENITDLCFIRFYYTNDKKGNLYTAGIKGEDRKAGMMDYWYLPKGVSTVIKEQKAPEEPSSESSVSSVPSESDVSSEPSVSSEASISDITPSVPSEAGSTSEPGSEPALPSMPSELETQPSEPGIPSESSVSDVPSVAPSTPGNESTPEVSGAPSEESKPSTSSVPSIESTPSASSVPSASGIPSEGSAPSEPSSPSGKTDLSAAKLAGVSNQYYTGKPVTFKKLTVTLADKTLKQNQDYKVSYQKNNTIGTATVILTGTGDYEGTIKKTFTISVKKKQSFTTKDGIKYTITDTKTNGKGAVTVVGVTTKDAKKALKSIKLETVKFGGAIFKITEIGNNAFKDCASLKSVVIGTNVTTIGSNAFKGDKNLKTITVKSKQLKKIGNSAFSGIQKKAVV
ncbi:MAG: leucine-rich repeat protein, partial [Lachnospiraceae bacterium]